MSKCHKCHFEIRKSGECFCTDRQKEGSLNFITDIEPHYNRALGMQINSRRQYKAELKERGLVEVGTEKKYVSPGYQEKLQERREEKHYDKIRPEAYKILSRCEGEPSWN